MSPVLLNSHRLGGGEELIFSHDFSTGVPPFTGTATQLAMGSAIGTSKPAYSQAAQRSESGLTGNEIRGVSILDLSTLPAATGRTLTRLTLWHCREITTSLDGPRSYAFEILQNGVTKFTETMTVTVPSTFTRDWALLEIPNPTGQTVARIRNANDAATWMPTGRIAWTGFELYAAA